MNIVRNLIIVTTLLLCSFNSIAKNWEHLFDHNKYQNAKISPNGEVIAIAMDYEGSTILVFLNREDMKTVGTARLSGGYEVGDYKWVNNERVVIAMVKHVPSLEEPQFYGELYAVNYDGKRGKIIYGYQAGQDQVGSRLKRKESIFGWASIIDVLPEDEKHILIKSTPMSKTGVRLSSVLLLNVYNGMIKKEMDKAPLPFSHFLTDTSGNIKAVVGTDEHNKRQLYLKKEDQWQKVPENTVGQSVSLISISSSGKYLYTRDNHNQDLFGIFKLNLNDFTYKSLYTDKNVDVTDVELTVDGRNAYAIRIDDGYPAYLILNKKLDEAAIFKDLLKTFPYSSINITSRSDDGEFSIIMVSSDTNPGQLYLFNKKDNKLTLLFGFKPEIQNKDLFQSEPIQLKARDGQLINGYFTQAKSSTNNALAPVVVMVHGGPHGIRDYWQFSNKIQYLVLNGYSVLQVNYRGSGGYGEKFRVDGYKVWGTTIQHDIYDGYQWLVDNNKAVAGNVCIMGASFGAYSAVQSATLYPDVYKCIIANAGVYNLELILEENGSRAVKSFWREALGKDKKELKSFSPVNYAGKIQAPLLLAHGEDDRVAPIEHVEQLKDALDEANRPYEWFVLDDEGHGFYNPANQKAYMRSVLSFLDKHLK
ncbi:prolyl oligopeptidase family serine peptidase [Thalassotalea sp. SU-HH00458]|uniref:alpha/beta hydrolase family protein n=1 Tax=Thalassotalea sp. SU-HH00458 TaxID=3127657 RepID=UPI0033653C2E